MSHNQSRAERSKSIQYRKTGRSGNSNQQRSFPAGVSTKGAGGASSAPSNSGGRSFKKYNNSNGQGGQPRARSPNVESDSAANVVQNGPHQKQPTQIPATSTTSNVKLTDAPTQKIDRAVPKGPSSNVSAAALSSNVSAANSESSLLTTPAKGDTSKSFPLQFGSISPGLMNGVQVPARTSSAPPNLDEQKKDQARQDSLRAAPSVLIPSVPKQHLPKKDDPSNASEAQPLSKSDKPSLEPSLKSLSLEFPDITCKIEESSHQEVTSSIVGSDDVKTTDKIAASTQTECVGNAENSVAVNNLSAHDDNTSRSDASLVTMSAEVNKEPDPVLVPSLPDGALKPENEDQCTDLPEGFGITSDIADALMVTSNISRESHPSPGRNIDRPVGGSRPDRRASGLGVEEKWNKIPGPPMPWRGDMWADLGYVGNIVGFRPGQVSNYGVLRHPCAQAPIHYAGGILSGPMHFLGPQGAMQINNSDSDRWKRGTSFAKGLIPPPQATLPVMHKAEKKYEAGKVADEEQAKQRQLKGILKKLTPQNCEKLFQQVKEVNIDNVVTLSGLILQIFDKALMEPTFCEMYADFCFHLAAGLPELKVDSEKITFKRLLLNKCQEEFERGEREEKRGK